MKKKVIVIMGLVFLLILASVIGFFVINTDKPDKNATSEYSDADIKRVGNFTATTAEQILKEEQNTCYSPLSLYAVLCTTAEVVTDESSGEILKAMNYGDLAEMESNYATILERVITLPDNKSSIVRLVDSIWIQEYASLPTAEDYINERVSNIDAEIYCKDFTKEEVNLWVKENTNGLMDEVLDYEPAILVANALYFCGEWDEQFENVGEDDFKLATGKTVQTEYMQKEEKTAYVSGNGYVAVKEDYRGNSSMIFVCPDKFKDVGDLVDEDVINEIIASFGKADYMHDMADVTLKVPKFQIESEYGSDMIETCLKSIGINKFYNTSSWSNLADDSLVEGIEVAQKTKLMVDEFGTEAAAVTSNRVNYTGDTLEKEIKLDIVLDKPFMYIIVKDDIPLFIGTVYNPAEG